MHVGGLACILQCLVSKDPANLHSLLVRPRVYFQCQDHMNEQIFHLGLTHRSDSGLQGNLVHQEGDRESLELEIPMAPKPDIQLVLMC